MKADYSGVIFHDDCRAILNEPGGCARVRGSSQPTLFRNVHLGGGVIDR